MKNIVNTNKNPPIIAFCGKPNVGKSALINALSGSRLRVGNWSGVTIERYEAHTRWEWQGSPQDLHLVDLPGFRDLSCSTQDQCIASNFLFDPDISVCVNVIEASNLRENLGLTLRLCELLAALDVPMILALNFADELKRLGWRIDTQALQQELEIPVVLVSARTKTGLEQLKEQILQRYSEHPIRTNVWQGTLRQAIQKMQGISTTAQLYASEQAESPTQNPWIPILTENHTLLKMENLQNLLSQEEKQGTRSYLHQVDTTSCAGNRTTLSFFEQRFFKFKEHASRIADHCLHKHHKSHRTRKSERADRILLHPVLGPFLGLLCLVVVFSTTFSFADPLISFVDQFFSSFLHEQIGKITESAPVWLDSLIRDGMFIGLGLILSFTPLMLILYILIGIMEESGYMTRIAFMADCGMARMGVSGHSLIPLFMGFGCNVPSIYATRTLESDGEKRITAFLAGFMSCGARMPVLGLFTATFLGPWAGFAVVALYLLGISVAVLISLFIKRMRYFQNNGRTFVMDIPPYHWPLLSTLSKVAGFRTWSYVKRASTRILALLTVLWLFTYFPAQGDIEKSHAASFAQWVQPVFEPLGFGNRWELIGALPTAIVAKEGALAALAQFLGGGFGK